MIITSILCLINSALQKPVGKMPRNEVIVTIGQWQSKIVRYELLELIFDSVLCSFAIDEWNNISSLIALHSIFDLHFLIDVRKHCGRPKVYHRKMIFDRNKYQMQMPNKRVHYSNAWNNKCVEKNAISFQTQLYFLRRLKKIWTRMFIQNSECLFSLDVEILNEIFIYQM